MRTGIVDGMKSSSHIEESDAASFHLHHLAGPRRYVLGFCDLDELGHIYLDNEKMIWDTKQKGAVGRMKTKGLEKIITRIEGEFSVQPFMKKIILKNIHNILRYIWDIYEM